MAIFGPKLSPAQRNKVEPTLLLWLDGKGTPETLGLPEQKTGSPRGVRVSVELSRAALAKDVTRYAALGIAIEAGETVAFGAVTRDALVTLARAAAVVFIQPSYPKSPNFTVSR